MLVKHKVVCAFCLTWSSAPYSPLSTYIYVYVYIKQENYFIKVCWEEHQQIGGLSAEIKHYNITWNARVLDRRNFIQQCQTLAQKTFFRSCSSRIFLYGFLHCACIRSINAFIAVSWEANSALC